MHGEDGDTNRQDSSAIAICAFAQRKRKTVKTLTARIIRHHGASVREVGAQELLQMMEIGFSLTTLSEMEARDMVYRIEQTIWNTIESEGELIKYETQCILPKVREN